MLVYYQVPLPLLYYYSEFCTNTSLVLVLEYLVPGSTVPGTWYQVFGLGCQILFSPTSLSACVNSQMRNFNDAAIKSCLV